MNASKFIGGLESENLVQALRKVVRRYACVAALYFLGLYVPETFVYGQGPAPDCDGGGEFQPWLSYPEGDLDDNPELLPKSDVVRKIITHLRKAGPFPTE